MIISKLLHKKKQNKYDYNARIYLIEDQTEIKMH